MGGAINLVANFVYALMGERRPARDGDWRVVRRSCARKAFKVAMVLVQLILVLVAVPGPGGRAVHRRVRRHGTGVRARAAVRA
ncbi:MAG: hypothetical protein MZW92_50535 [Comamonadaceae bacterium]|nr:hypothetical protein [Comamonadaceae bacterium]